MGELRVLLLVSAHHTSRGSVANLKKDTAASNADDDGNTADGPTLSWRKAFIQELRSVMIALCPPAPAAKSDLDVTLTELRACGGRSLTAKCLCERHNGSLHPLDDAALFFFRSVKAAFEGDVKNSDYLI